MSLIIAIKNQAGLVMGCDSAIMVEEGRVEKVECFSNAKIWAMSEVCLADAYLSGPTVLIGGVGTVRDINVVKAKVGAPSDLDADTIVLELMPEIRDALIEYGFISGEKPYSNMDSSFVVGDRDHLYIIGHDYSVIERNDFAVIGYCDNEAKALIEKDLPKIRKMSISELGYYIEEIILHCAKSCTFVDGPVYTKVLMQHND